MALWRPKFGAMSLGEDRRISVCATGGRSSPRGAVGIGRAIAQSFLPKGACVAVCDIDIGVCGNFETYRAPLSP